MGEYTKTSKSESLDNLFGAIADPTRRAILDRLALGNARVTEIAADFPISLNSVSKHLRMLERAGLVSRTIKGREHLLALNSEPLDRASEWIDHHRRFWDDSLAALEKFVSQKHPPAHKPGAPIKRKSRK